MIPLAVVGAHLRGLPLHHQLAERDAVFLEETTTAPFYRLFALTDETGRPVKPAMVRVAEGGGAIALEIWALEESAFGSFVAALPTPMVIGRVALSDGREVAGFLAESYALAGREDITAFGGWRAYLARE